MRLEVFFDEDELFDGDTEGTDVEASKDNWATLLLAALVEQFPGVEIEVTELAQVMGKRMKLYGTLEEEMGYWDIAAIVQEIEEDLYSAMEWPVATK